MIVEEYDSYNIKFYHFLDQFDTDCDSETPDSVNRKGQQY